MLPADNPRPYTFAGSIQQGRLPPDLDTAYRGVHWLVRESDLLVGCVRIASNNARFANEEMRSKGAEIARQASTTLTSMLPWFGPILSSVHSLADELLLSRGSTDPVRCGHRSADTFHEMGVAYADLAITRALGTLPSSWRDLIDDEEAFGAMFLENMQGVGDALASAEPMPGDFCDALRREALALKLFRLQRPVAANVVLDAPPPTPAAPTTPADERKNSKPAQKLGRRPLEESDPARWSLYQIVLVECESKHTPGRVAASLKERRDVIELAEEIGERLNAKFVRKVKTWKRKRKN